MMQAQVDGDWISLIGSASKQHIIPEVNDPRQVRCKVDGDDFREESTYFRIVEKLLIQDLDQLLKVGTGSDVLFR